MSAAKAQSTYASVRSAPRAVLFAHLFAAIFFLDHPLYAVWNRHHLQFGTMPIGFGAQLFHDPVRASGHPEGLAPRIG